MARGVKGSGPKSNPKQETKKMPDQIDIARDEILGDSSPDAIAEQDAIDAAKADQKAERGDPSHVTIIINAQESAGGNNAVPVQVNGKAWLIPREQEFKVPYPVLHALENAVARETIWDGKTNARTSHSRRRYPVSIIEKHWDE